MAATLQTKRLQIKKALKKGDYLQGSNANLLSHFGPAQGGEAGGEIVTYFYEYRATRKFHPMPAIF